MNKLEHDVLFIPADPEMMEQERRKAKELKRSQWWKNQLGRGQCYYCQRRYHPKELTMDHVQPISRGGRSSHSNCVPCCGECNEHKKNWPAESFRAWVEEMQGKL
ncbi:HNH nuclease [Magnetococcus marinus MC-1]|uniref:HNH nuclease n=1 Tax=Magnetococcus marinus (strain ATCC BAA-1437 / JCM 17883 / MC-1) TaxID=156889 RepID=A0LBT0_MAGMM|nr:HNH endonuclease [Magnetococcus marinus]ABK45423.1 HNH nuclease [Magnetococcus marinus MC-1]